MSAPPPRARSLAAGWSSPLPTTDPADADTLLPVLEQARALGFLGPGPLVAHLTNADGFAAALGSAAPPVTALDLGCGGGVPGLVLAQRWPTTRWLLLDAARRRCAFLREAVELLGLEGRVVVIEARAEEAGRDLGLRQRIDVVTARAFARPAITAECAAPLLVEGGCLLVSDPPDDQDRWDRAGLTTLGLVDEGIRTAPGAHIRVVRKSTPSDERYPRRVGIPAKRPLW
ncbi:MAG: RsmG family class I SAM-dependent methyltransferase [Acidimicrobiales bacterium]